VPPDPVSYAYELRLNVNVSDILLSEEAPESDYEYVNPVHVILIDDDKDEVVSTRSSSPPTSWNPHNNNPGGNNASRSKQTNNTPTRAPSGVSASSHVKTKPISLPPMPTMSPTTAAASTKKRLGPPVPPRKHLSAVDGLRRRLDHYNDLDDDDNDCRSEPTVTPDVQDNRVHGSRHWQPFNHWRRANSVDSLLHWQPATSSPSDSESEIGFRPNSTTPPRIRNNRPLLTLKFRGDLGLVPTNIASLSVEEVNN